MTIQIDYETEKSLDIDYTRLANLVAEQILKTENCPYYNQYGDKVGEDVKRTAGEPAQMKFSVETPDHEPIACMVEGCTDEHTVLLNADGNDLAFVTVSLLDKDGNECPLADDELTFEVTGAGTFKAACNGDATSLEPFTHPHMKLFSGKLVVIVQSSTQKGNITLKVKDGKRNIEKTIQLEAIYKIYVLRFYRRIPFLFTNPKD